MCTNMMTRTVIKANGRELKQDYACKQCRECRNQRKGEWAFRCYLEAMQHPRASAFITLTYSPEFLPGPPGKYGAGSLNPDDYRNFLKRLRKNTGLHPLHFGCGEYGTDNHRPHYHLNLFGILFDNLYLEVLKAWSVPGHDTRKDYLEKAIPMEYWPYLKGRKVIGRIDVQEFDIKAAVYTANYTMKGHTSAKNWVNAYGDDPRPREFMRSSCRPHGVGLGEQSINYVAGLFRRMKVVIKGHPRTNIWGDDPNIIELDEFPTFLPMMEGGKIVSSYPLDPVLKERVKEALGMGQPDKQTILEESHTKREYNRARPVDLLDYQRFYEREQRKKQQKLRMERRRKLSLHKKSGF